jgi:hypothetical protein
MPGQKPVKSAAWRWFKEELARRLGSDEVATLWAELQRRRRLEYDDTRRKRVERELRYYEALLAERTAQGRATARIEQAIARRRRWLGVSFDAQEDNHET